MMPIPLPSHNLPALQQIASFIQQNQRFLITAHQGPDGDAIGSVLALCGVLRHLHKEVVVFNDRPYPELFRFLPFADCVRFEIASTERFDVTILCDCGEASRAPYGFPTDPAQRGHWIVLDHHATCALEGDTNLNDPSAPAVGVLVYQLASILGVPLSVEIAQNIYCSILCDTGSFRYQKTNPYAFRVAAELLEAGVDTWEISSAIFESVPAERQRLLARTLDTLELFAQNRLAILHIDDEMYAQTGATHEMTDGFINFARGIRGVEVAILFRQSFGGWKLSLRSRGLVDVATYASLFQGGGHHNAAGAFVTGSLLQAKTAIERTMSAYLDVLFNGHPQPDAQSALAAAKHTLAALPPLPQTSHLPVTFTQTFDNLPAMSSTKSPV